MHISGLPLAVSLSSDLNGEIIPPLRRFLSIQPRASLSLLVKKKQHLCMSCCCWSGAKMFVHSPRSLSLLPCLGAIRKTVMYVYLIMTNGPWVLTTEPLRFVLPLKVRKEEKGAESPLGRVQFLQRNEESFHHVSCKPVMVPSVRQKGTERSWLAY